MSMGFASLAAVKTNGFLGGFSLPKDKLSDE